MREERERERGERSGGERRILSQREGEIWVKGKGGGTKIECMKMSSRERKRVRV